MSIKPKFAQAALRSANARLFDHGLDQSIVYTGSVTDSIDVGQKCR